MLQKGDHRFQWIYISIRATTLLDRLQSQAILWTAIYFLSIHAWTTIDPPYPGAANYHHLRALNDFGYLTEGQGRYEVYYGRKLTGASF